MVDSSQGGARGEQEQRGRFSWRDLRAPGSPVCSAYVRLWMSQIDAAANELARLRSCQMAHGEASVAQLISARAMDDAWREGGRVVGRS